jgi:hypothetical protein
VQPPEGRKSGESRSGGAGKGSRSDRDEDGRDDAPSGVGALPRLVGRAASDLAGISDLLRAVPQISEHLGSIRKSVSSMDREIRGMRKSVDEVVTRVEGLRGGVEGKLGEVDSKVAPMSEDVRLMRIAVEQLDSRLVELERTLRPMRRTAEFLRLRRKGEPDLAVELVDDDKPEGGEER